MRTCLSTRWLAAALAVAAGCSSGADARSHIGDLHERRDKKYDLDLDDLDDGERDAVERALAMPHREATRRLGPHRAVWDVRQSAYAAGALLEKLDDKYTIEADAAGNFSLLETNSEDYKKEIVWTGGDLYVGTRYGLPVHRRPVGDEATGWRDDAWTVGATYWRLLKGGLLLDRAGEESVAGRSALKITVTADPEKGPTAGERAAYDRADPAKAWRATIKLESASGSLWFDAETGVPLKADLELKYTAVKDGREARWTVQLALAVEAIGAVAALGPPAKFVESPERVRMIIDREAVLGEKRVDVASLSEAELRAMAETYGLAVPKGAGRAELVKMLRAHDPSLKESVLVDSGGKVKIEPPSEPAALPPDAGPIATDEIPAGKTDEPPPEPPPDLAPLEKKGPESAPAAGDAKKKGKGGADGKVAPKSGDGDDPPTRSDGF
jgi:hypothetical protein